MKNYLWAIVLLLVFVVGGVYFYTSNQNQTIGQVACTEEAKQCPDGSYVGRTGPGCAFAACPTSTSTSQSNGTLEGTMAIGPICPVEQIGHPCNPTPEMYAAHQVFVYTSDRTKIIATLTPDAQGHFFDKLPVGNYLVDVQHQAIGAVQGAPRVVTIVRDQTTTLTISIDTGIR